MLTISENFNDYASRITQALDISGLRVELDNSKEKIGYKIRQQTLNKVPCMIIIGKNEVETGQVNLRLLNGEQVNLPDLDSAIDYLKQMCRAPGVIDQQQALEALRVA